jgi:copper chaperone CopZ
MLELKVGGMSCDGCVKSISKAIGRVPGVRSVDVALGSGTVVVHGAPERDAVEKAVVAAGYTVNPA